MIKTIYSLLSEKTKLKRCNIGDFSRIQGRGMRFSVRVYDSSGYGSICFMKMKAFFDLMKMETAVFSPVEIDGPLFSCEYIEAFGIRTLFLELYDTTLSHPDFSDLKKIVEKYRTLLDYDPGKHWYDDIRLTESDFKKGRIAKQDLLDYAEEYSRGYFDILQRCASCDPAIKRQKNAEYADGLLRNGGPAVDQFIKMMGSDQTETFLKSVMFAAK